MYNFILWVAVMEKLRTRDRLRFLDIDPLCVFCRLYDEIHNHLFFKCPWTSLLWRMAKSWFWLHKSMSTINSAIHGFLSGRNNLVGRTRRVSSGILIYLIWEERIKRVLIILALMYLLFFTDSRFSSTWFCIFMNSFCFRVVVCFCLLGLPVFLLLMVMAFHEWGCSVG